MMPTILPGKLMKGIVETTKKSFQEDIFQEKNLYILGFFIQIEIFFSLLPDL